MAFKADRVERDYRLEESYSFHRAHPKETVLAHVAANRDQLVADYFDWATTEPFQEPSFTMLPRFETHRFGKELEPAAHGILAFAVRWREEKFKTPPDAQFDSFVQRETVEAAALEAISVPVEGEGSEALVRRIAVSSGLIAPDAPKKPLVKAMPEAPLEVVYEPHNDGPRVDMGPDDDDAHAPGGLLEEEPPEPDDDDFWLEPDAGIS